LYCTAVVRAYSTFPVQVDEPQVRLRSGYESGGCIACRQLQQVPCGYARAPPRHHRYTATVILTSLLASVLLETKNSFISWTTITVNYSVTGRTVQQSTYRQHNWTTQQHWDEWVEV